MNQLIRGKLQLTDKQQEIIEFTRREPSLAHLPVGYEGARARFVLALAVCGTVMGAARAAGTSTASAYQWMIKDPVYKARCEEAREIALMRVEEAAFDMALGTEKYAPNPAMIQFLLRTRMPQVYGDRREVVHSGQITGKVSPEMLETTGGTNQLQEVLKVLRAAGALDSDIVEGEFVEEASPSE